MSVKGADMASGTVRLDDEGNEVMPSAAPLSVRGPFSVIDSLREHASKNRLRHRMDGFNLDLRYVTQNIVAMAAPSDRGLSVMVRNHVDEVVRFFRLKHEGKAIFFNLIGEANSWQFDSHRLGVVNHQFAFLDHCVPTLAHMQAFCLTVKQWLDKDPANVAVIMCRSGRNRTAVMTCAYLLFRWPAEFRTAEQAMDYFSHRRLRTGEPAVTEPSQRRWISYFSQRFAAVPQTIKLSKLVVPHAPLKLHKMRLTIHRLVQGSQSGNAMDAELVWTSKGKGMGAIEPGESYVIFSFPDSLQLSGDIKIALWGRKFANGPFTPILCLWFNTGFVDHTPMVWDKQCFDALGPGHKKDLPDDFHIQTLFVGQPRVACSISKISPARIYCWDCEDPFLSETESIAIHRPKMVVGPDGEEEEEKTGPRHRYHPLIEEECAMCERRRVGWEELNETKDRVVHHEGMLMKSKSAHSTIEFRDRYQKEQTLSSMTGANKFTSDTKVYSTEEGLKLISARKAIMEREREQERLTYENAGRTEKEKPPMYNFPTVYCEDTKQYLCAWCNRFALGPHSKDYTRIAIPVIPSSAMRYSGCARQTC